DPVHDYISGITFDGAANPLIIGAHADYVKRLDLTNASVLATQTLNLNRTGVRCLEYDAATGNYFFSQQVGPDALGVLNLSSGTQTVVGSSFANFNFNFLSLAEDPSGNLWMMTDYDTHTTFGATIY